MKSWTEVYTKDKCTLVFKLTQKGHKSREAKLQLHATNNECF